MTMNKDEPVAKRFVVSDNAKNVRIHGWRLLAKMGLPGFVRPISTHTPIPVTVE